MIDLSLTIRHELLDVVPTRMQVVQPCVMLRETHGQVSAKDSQIYFGEYFDVYVVEDGVAYGQNQLDRYTGHVDLQSLSAELITPTHRVRNRHAFVYPVPNLKAEPVMTLGMGAFVEVIGVAENGYVPLSIGYIRENALKPIAVVDPDPVALACELLGAPYLWGGRQPSGIDCSGLVQLVYSMAGEQIDRDSAIQEQNFGMSVSMDDMQRNDLIFAKGHVAIVESPMTVIHANDEIHGMVVRQSFTEAHSYYNFRTVRRSLKSDSLS